MSHKTIKSNAHCFQFDVIFAVLEPVSKQQQVNENKGTKFIRTLDIKTKTALVVCQMPLFISPICMQVWPNIPVHTLYFAVSLLRPQAHWAADTSDH